MFDFSDREEVVVAPTNHDFGKAKCYNIITKDLDKMSGITKENYEYGYHHYILNNDDDNLFVIRIPGGTVGYVKYNDENIITEIHVDTDYVVSTYWRNVNKHLQKDYIGKKIIFEDHCDKEI